MNIVQPHLLKKAIDQGNSPYSILKNISYSTSQKFIPHKHSFVQDLPSLIITHVPLETSHHMVGVTKVEILSKIHHAQELLVSMSPINNNVH